MSENYEMQCGEIFLHLLNGKLSFTCTLCENKYKSFQEYALHVATEHSPAVEVEVENMENMEPEEPLYSDSLIKEEQQETLEFDDMSYNSYPDEFVNEYDQVGEEYIENVVNTDEIEPEIDKEFFSKPIQPKIRKAKRRAKAENTENLLNENSDARPVRIKYINKADIRKHKCPECNFSCKLLRNLRGHLRRHDKVKPFPCEYCDKGFYTTTEYKVHLRSHTGEKPYACESCNHSFVTNSKLSEHRRKVHGIVNQKFFDCSNCELRFNDAKLLREHRATQHVDNPKVYRCKICADIFYKSEDLAKHKKEHKGQFFKCDICEAKFETKPSLHAHMESKHMSMFIKHFDEN